MFDVLSVLWGEKVENYWVIMLRYIVKSNSPSKMNTDKTLISIYWYGLLSKTLHVFFMSVKWNMSQSIFANVTSLSSSGQAGFY